MSTKNPDRILRTLADKALADAAARERATQWSEELRWQYDPTRGGYKEEPGSPCWRELGNGDLVLTDFGRTLAQLHGVVDGHVRLVLIHDATAGHHFPPGTYRLVDASAVRLLPPMQLPVRRRTLGAERSWVSEFEELLALVRAHLPPSHDVRRAFEFAVEDPGFPGMIDDARPAREAVEGFYANLSHGEQRRVLNGWRPFPHHPTADEVKPGSVETPRLTVEVLRAGEPLVVTSWQPSGLTIPCFVTLYANTTKA